MVGNYDKETGKKIVKLINEIKVKQMDYTKTMLESEGKQVKLDNLLHESDKNTIKGILELSEMYWTYKAMADKVGEALSKHTDRFMTSLLENEAKQEVTEENDMLCDFLLKLDADDVVKVICGGNVVYYGAIKDGTSPYIDGHGKLDPYIDMVVTKEKYEDFVPVFYVEGEENED